MGTERFVDLIQKKKSGETLTKEEIDFMISEYARSESESKLDYFKEVLKSLR